MLALIERLDARNNGHIDADFACFISESVERLVIKKHLSDNKVSSRVNFSMQISEICFHIWGLKMLFRVARHADAEICFVRVFYRVQVNTLVHELNLLDKICGTFVCKSICRSSARWRPIAP